MSRSVSHAAHSVASPDLSGKQDVRKANGDERAILGMKMKKGAGKYAPGPPQVCRFPPLALSPLRESTGHSRQAMKATENGWAEQEVHMNHAAGVRGMWFTESAPETGCSAGAPKSIGAHPPLKLSSLSVLLQQLAVKDISSGLSFNHGHRFHHHGSVLRC